MVRGKVVVRVPEAAVPATVRVDVPGLAVAPTLRVSVEVVPAVTDAGANEPVTPEGAPLNDIATDCQDPDVTFVLTATVADDPCTALTEVGVALIPKSLGVVTWSATSS